MLAGFAAMATSIAPTPLLACPLGHKSRAASRLAAALLANTWASGVRVTPGGSVTLGALAGLGSATAAAARTTAAAAAAAGPVGGTMSMWLTHITRAVGRGAQAAASGSSVIAPSGGAAGGAGLAARRLACAAAGGLSWRRPILLPAIAAHRTTMTAATAGRGTAAMAERTVAGARVAPIAALTRGSALLARGAHGRVVAGPSLTSSIQIRTVWRDRNGYEHFGGRGRAWPLGSAGARYGALGAATAFALYYVWCLETVPYTGRRHSIMFVSTALEQWMGESLFEEITTAARAEGRLLPPGHPASQRVQRIGQQIARVAADGFGGGHDRHMRHLDWQFAVIDDPQANAFVVPGGKVVVFRGLLQLLGSNDDELAAVMAHEVGHVVARHVAERMSLFGLWRLVNVLLALAFGITVPGAAVALGVLLPYSRRAEEEADLIGLRLMARACFDPMGAPTMLSKINNAEQRAGIVAQIPEFLRTHPLTDQRVKRVEAELRDAYRLYAASGCEARRGAFGRAAAVLNVGWPQDWSS